MQLETVQMMCTAVRRHLGLEDATREELPDELKFLYKTAHPKHGSTVWVGDSFANFKWAFQHTIAMRGQQKLRFGTSHKSFKVGKWAYNYAHAKRRNGECIFPRSDLTAPYMAFGPELEHLKDPCDPVGSYRKFYIADKAKFATWRYTDPPHWWPKL